MTDFKFIPISDKVSEDVYNDLAHPVAAEAGKLGGSFGRLVNAIFSGGMDLLSHKIEQGWENLAKKYEEGKLQIPEERRQEPDPQIVSGVLSGYAATVDKPEVQKLFENLLIASADKELAAGILPSFTEILKSMSCDEAKILEFMASQRSSNFAKLDLYQRASKDGKILIAKNLLPPQIRAVCFCPNNISSYFDNLNRMGLIEVSDTTFLTGASGEAAYLCIKRSINVAAIKVDGYPANPADFQWKEGIFRLTNFGSMLCIACGIKTRGVPVYPPS
mgnify:CR=1 FL=1